MLRKDNRTHPLVNYVVAAILMLAFALSFFSCIQETLTFWFPERMDDPSPRVEYFPMLPGFPRYLLIPAAALLLIGKLWADILSGIFLILPLLVALGMETIYELFEPMGGLGGYTYEYTLLGRIVVGLLLLGFAGEILILIAAIFNRRAK
jgi:hypothetical protein